MSQRPRRRADAPRQIESTPASKYPTWLPPGRECPWCGSRDTVFVKRGLAGGEASPNQFIRCYDCGRVTYDIVAKSDREIRINSYRQGGSFRDPEFQTRYTIYRMLKVGFNEFLLYLRPILPEDSTSQDHHRQ